MEDEGLLSKEALLSGELAAAFGIEIDEPGEVEEEFAADEMEPLSRGEDA